MTWKMSKGLLKDILDKLKDPSIKPNMSAVCRICLAPLTEAYTFGRICEVYKSACLMFSGTPCNSSRIYLTLFDNKSLDNVDGIKYYKIKIKRKRYY